VNDNDQLEDSARQLADAVDAALPSWVVASVERIYRAWADRPPPVDVAEEAAEAGRRAQAEVGRRVRTLLEADVDEQRTTPLTLLRAAVTYPTAVLRAAGVPDVQRDAVAEDMFPDDPYDLTPTSFADLGPTLQDLGIRWGAAKAWTHKRRHGNGGPGGMGPA
jgi:hypothetical protein